MTCLTSDWHLIYIYQGPPEEPYNVAILLDSTTSSSITLTWYSGFHGGADQTFHILYKTSEGSQWREGATVPGGKQTYSQFNGTVTVLESGISYMFFISAVNVYGSKNSKILNARTENDIGRSIFF